MSALTNPYLGFGQGNPSPAMTMPYGGYGMGSNPYSASYGGGYGMGSNPYAGKSGGNQQAPAAASPKAQSAYERLDLGTVLTAWGVPNDHGKVSWPLAFRLMPPAQSQEMREPLGALLRLAAAAVVQGQAPPAMLQAAGTDVAKMRRWLRDREAGMAEATYRDGDRFLRRVEQALKTMNVHTPTAAAELAQAAESIGIYDKSFAPKELTVATGTIVRWTNHGQHIHTVTGHAGAWDSGDISPGLSFGVIFHQPGTYGYYCSHHPQEMQARIVVR